MSTVFFMSDPHVGGHEKVASTRGFRSTRAHDQAILATIRALPLGSQLWMLGDNAGRNDHEPFALGLLDEVFRDRQIEAHLIAGNHDSCLDTETRAVTKRGFVHIDDLRGDDEVLTVDDILGSVWVKPSRIIRYPHIGTVTRIQSKNVDSFTTNDHRVVGLQRTKRGWSSKWIESRADAVQTSTLGIVASGAGSKSDVELSDWSIRMAAWCHTDAHYDGRYWTFHQSENKKGRIEELLSETPHGIGVVHLVAAVFEAFSDRLSATEEVSA